MADMETNTDTTPGKVAADGSEADVAVETDEGSGGGREAIAGGIMVGLTVLAALLLRWRSGPNFIDTWGSSLVHPAPHNSTWVHITQIRSTSFLVAGSILAAVVVIARDRWRALACLITPTLAVLLTEYFLKPVIARRYEQVLTFPSGSTTVVAAVAMAWIIAVPRWIRPVVVIIGAFVVGLECMAVVALQWHFPSDAIGGAVFGAGMVLLVDGLIHLAVGSARGRQASATPTPAVDAPSS